MVGLNNCTKHPTLDYEFELLVTRRQILALDEVGRGALAGPVAVGAQLFEADFTAAPQGIRDSKLLSEKQREKIYPEVCAWGQGAVGFSSPQTVDCEGITRALGLAGVSAITQLLTCDTMLKHTVVLLDGKHDWLTAALPELLQGLQVVTKVGADRACATVAAASIRAKVARDRLMQQAALEYPGYGWESNKGYGSKAHLAAIAEKGITPLHRASWIKSATPQLF